MIGILAHRQMLAFAHHVPDVAEHEEIAGHRARQAGDIVGIAGHEPGGEALGEMRTSNSASATASLTRFDSSSPSGDVLFPGELDKAAGEIGVAGGQRGLDILGDQAGRYSAGQN